MLSCFRHLYLQGSVRFRYVIVSLFYATDVIEGLDLCDRSPSKPGRRSDKSIGSLVLSHSSVRMLDFFHNVTDGISSHQ